MRTKKTYAEMKEHLDLLREKRKAKALAKGPPDRSRKPLKRSAIKKVSKTMASKLKLYSDQRKRFLEENTICPVTGQPTTQVHHMMARGKYLLDESTWLAVSSEGHEWIESHKNQAREKGWILYK